MCLMRFFGACCIRNSLEVAADIPRKYSDIPRFCVATLLLPEFLWCPRHQTQAIFSDITRLVNRNLSILMLDQQQTLPIIHGYSDKNYKMDLFGFESHCGV